MANKSRQTANLVSSQTGVAVTISGDPIVLGVGNTELVRITESGRVGVGTQSPSETIHLVDSVPTIRFEDTELGPTVYGSVGGNGGNIILKADEQNASGSTRIAFEIDGSEKLRMDSDGNVAIGTDTNTYNLEVYKHQNAGTVVEINNQNTQASAHARLGLDADVASLNFYSHGSGRSLTRYETVLNEWSEISNTNGNGIVIGTQNQVPIRFGTNDNLRVVINGDNGYVGIGTTNADSPLHLENPGPALTFIDTDDASKSRLRYNTPNFILEADINEAAASSRISLRIDDAGVAGEIFAVDSVGAYFNGGTTAFEEYEEGTWSPEVADASSGGNTGSGTFDGYYTRVGNLVYLQASLANIDTTGMTGANNFYIRGLPFGIRSQNGAQRNTTAVTATFTTYTGSNLVAAAQDDTDFIRLFVEDNTGGSANDPLQVNALNSGSADIRFSIWYPI